MWECRSDSAEEVSHEGCHTRHEDSFLFSVSYLRRWHRSGPVWLRSLQPNSAGSGRLHVASRFLCVCRDWPKTHQFSVFSGIPSPLSPRFPLPWTSSAPECNDHFGGRAAVTSAQCIWFLITDKKRTGWRSYRGAGLSPGDHVQQMEVIVDFVVNKHTLSQRLAAIVPVLTPILA